MLQHISTFTCLRQIALVHLYKKYNKCPIVQYDDAKKLTRNVILVVEW